MKNFAIFVINNDTGDVEHCASHFIPIPIENAPIPETGSYTVELYEFQTVDENVPFVRAREVLDRVVKVGVTLPDKAAAVVTLRNPVADTLMTDLFKVDEFTVEEVI